ncbi:MAG: hypothetical protein J6W06_07230 [Bacteroidales bacterium]|jgi:hypothetical protein|nr:hypothetical protein [Bacteroidales bacterium]
MKAKVIAIALAIFSMTVMPFVASGQEQDSITSKIYMQEPETSTYSFDMAPRNEISISAGTISGFGAFFDFFKVIFEGIGNGISKKNTDTKFIGTYGIDYYYQVNPWFRPGAKFVYEGLKTTVSDSTGIVNQYNTSTISLMASVQFTYLNKKYVKLYSGIDLGVTNISDNNKNSSVSSTILGANITLIGIRVGNDYIFGVVETNIGMDALIKAGFGVRF